MRIAAGKCCFQCFAKHHVLQGDPSLPITCAVVEVWHGVGGMGLMNINNEFEARPDNDLSEGSGNKELWQTLSAAGNRRLLEFRKKLHAHAPVPGEIVLLNARKLPRASSSFDSVLLSAIDACTHLQLARIYFVSSLAATIDFVEFLVRAYPFHITEFRTYDNPLLAHERDDHEEHRFALAAHRCGIRHRAVIASEDDCLPTLERYLFPEIEPAPIDNNGSEEQSAKLERFLFFHNNDRSLPTLGGKTPLEAIRHFPEFRRVASFSK